MIRRPRAGVDPIADPSRTIIVEPVEAPTPSPSPERAPAEPAKPEPRKPEKVPA